MTGLDWNLSTSRQCNNKTSGI